MTQTLLDFFSAYFLYITAVVPIIALLGMVFSSEGRAELISHAGTIIYFLVTLPYIYLNIFTTIPHMFIPVFMANIIHVLLCLGVFMLD